MSLEAKKNPILIIVAVIVLIYRLIPKEVVVVSRFGRDVVYFKK